ncbi:MAG: CsgG/HfaB family protein [bacterium]
MKFGLIPGILFLLILQGGLSAIFSQSLTGKPEKMSVAVLDFQAKGMSAEEVTALSDRFRTELFNVGKFIVMERGQMDAIMNEQGFQKSGACTDEACLVEMGQLLGVDRMVAGSIGKLGQLYLINVRIINIATGQIERTVSEDCNCPIEGLIVSLKKVAMKLGGEEKKAESKPVEQTPSVKTVEKAPAKIVAAESPSEN